MSKKYKIYIDTSALINRKPEDTTALSECITKEEVEVYTSYITQEEFKSNISTAAKQKISIGFGKKELEEHFRESVKEKLVSIIVEKKMKIYNSWNPKDIKVFKNVALKSIFQDYFNKKPPFGEDKKKYEFPDAIVLHAIKKANIKDIILISSDKDWQTYADTEHIKFFDSIAEFLKYKSSGQNWQDYIDFQDYEYWKNCASKEELECINSIDKFSEYKKEREKICSKIQELKNNDTFVDEMFMLIPYEEIPFTAGEAYCYDESYEHYSLDVYDTCKNIFVLQLKRPSQDRWECQIGVNLSVYVKAEHPIYYDHGEIEFDLTLTYSSKDDKFTIKKDSLHNPYIIHMDDPPFDIDLL